LKNIAVVGLGSIAKRHRSNIRKIFPFSSIYCVSSSGREVTEYIENCDFLFGTIEELIDAIEIDFVIVSSPASHHIVHSIPFVESKIPVLIEKPLAMNLGEVEKLINLRDKVNGIASVAYCLRYSGVLIELHKLIKSKKIGKIHHASIHVGQDLKDWRPDTAIEKSVSANKKLGGGVLNELSHEMDYMIWLMGEVEPLFSRLNYNQRYAMEVEDMADVILQTSNKTLITLHLDFLQQTPQRYCQLITERGRFDINLLDQTIHKYENSSVSCIYDNSKEDANNKYIAMIDDFIRNINGQNNHCVTLEEAQETMELIQAIRLCDQGERV
jgi:predicted dehydrogenase